MKYMSFKKAFAKFIADCPDVAEQVREGEYKAKAEDLMKIMEGYESCN